MKKTISVALASLLAVNGTAYAAGCASPREMAALKTAALQQELMVAAFSCHAIRQYNHFVLAHRAELMESDASLKAYFVHTRGGEAGYHTYKTDLANDSSLRSINDTDAFCAGADDDFDLTADSGSIAGMLDDHDWQGTGNYEACAAPPLETAAAAPRPVHRSGRDGMSAPAPHHRIDADSL